MTKRKFVDLSTLALGGKSEFLADALFRIELLASCIQKLKQQRMFQPIYHLTSHILCQKPTEQIFRFFYISNDGESNFIRVFDEDNSGAMDFAEYMLALNAINLNTPQAYFTKLIFHFITDIQEKLNWMFDVFDQDGGGTISVDEIQDLLR